MIDKRRLNLDKIEAGQQAGMIASVVGPYVNDMISVKVNQMTTLYRGAQYTHDQIIGKVAEIAALLDMMHHLEGQQRIGDGAAEKEFGNASQTPQ